MKLDVSVEIPYSREKVYACYRDKLVDLVPYLPNVRGITVTTRTDEGTTCKMLNRWKGGGDIPAVVRKFLPDSALEWDDYATWKADAFTCDWKIVVMAFTDAVKAGGHNRFEDLGPTRCRLIINGDLEVDASKIRGVPRLLAGVISPQVERFLVAAIRPNLVETSKGVERYLNEHKE